MNASRSPADERPSARIRLIDAAHYLVRRKGYAATSVDDHSCGNGGFQGLAVS